MEMNDDGDNLPQRKHRRLRDYDYSQNGCYFVTVCTKDRQCILSRVVGRDDLIPPEVQLSEYGFIVDDLIHGIPVHYNFVQVHKYVVMPNHVHLLLMFDGSFDGGMGSSRPTLQTIIHALKTLASRKAGISFWQDSFHDHIIRDDNDYQTHWQYIHDNPAKWAEDEYYIE
jgi:REP element-mobilizing transposase RayT